MQKNDLLDEKEVEHMNDNNTDFLLKIINGSLVEQEIANKILRCNEDSKKYELVLTEQQALALADTRSVALKKAGRIEFGEGIIDKLITAFCSSPYISQQNYEETLHELIVLFYDFKSDTWDIISDDELIQFMKDAFNSHCHGSLELLSGKVLTELSRHIHSGNSFESFMLQN